MINILKNPSAQLTLKPILPDDVNAMHSIDCKVSKPPWSKKSYLSSIEIGDGLVLKIENDRHAHILIGFILTTHVVDETQILKMAIAPCFQGFGYGRFLLTTMIQMARARNSKYVFLEVRESNIRALNLYQSLNFSSIAIRKDYYPTENGKENAVVMRLELFC